MTGKHRKSYTDMTEKELKEQEAKLKKEAKEAEEKEFPPKRGDLKK